MGQLTFALDLDLADYALAVGGICFVRAEPPACRAYWYLVQPALFGGVDLVRVWGRYGHQVRRPRLRVEPYEDLARLELELRGHLQRRLQRGYVACERPLELERAVAA